MQKSEFSLNFPGKYRHIDRCITYLRGKHRAFQAQSQRKTPTHRFTIDYSGLFHANSHHRSSKNSRSVFRASFLRIYRLNYDLYQNASFLCLCFVSDFSDLSCIKVYFYVLFCCDCVATTFVHVALPHENTPLPPQNLLCAKQRKKKDAF
jgi:hypothetical protein